MQIAMEAGDGQGYLRVNDDVNLLEIVDCDGKLLPYGQRGRIVVTRLMGNGDQPLRLDLQDEGVLELPHVNDPLQARKFKIFGRAGTYLRIATWDIRVEDILTTTGSKLTKIIPTDEILGRQLILDEESVILRVAVKDKNKLSVPSLQSQYDLMRDAIVEARDMTFFDDPQDFPRSLKLAIELVDLETLQKTSSGKTASFVNRRGKNKTS
jgi:phenylacetate-coenzyme A ligase PaaK-like adenylate-forming protein